MNYVDNLDELAKKAGDLFEQQPTIEKRKLLRLVVEKCKWREGILSYGYKQPFDMLAEPSTHAVPVAA